MRCGAAEDLKKISQISSGPRDPRGGGGGENKQPSSVDIPVHVVRDGVVEVLLVRARAAGRRRRDFFERAESSGWGAYLKNTQNRRAWLPTRPSSAVTRWRVEWSTPNFWHLGAPPPHSTCRRGVQNRKPPEGPKKHAEQTRSAPHTP